MLAYERFGDGDHKVLALHGWLGDERLLDPMRHALDQTRFDYLIPAYRGYGRSAKLPGNYHLEEIVQDIAELLDRLDWSRFSIIGHSMGALVGQRLLLDWNGSIERLIAVAPVSASGARFDAETLALFRAATTDMAARRAIIDFSTGNRLAPAWLDLMTNETARARTTAMDAYLTMFTSTDISQKVSGLELPVNVLVGSFDPAQTETEMRGSYLRLFPRATLEAVPGAGHCPFDETPVYLAAAIERLLAE